MQNESMKVLQIMAPGEVVWRDAPIPTPGAGEALVKVAAITTCPHWDLHLMSGEPMFPGVPLPYPYTPGQPGHEMTGEVVAIGPGVTELAVGDRVAAWRDAGARRQGCYAQYVPFQVENLIQVPAAVPAEAVASLELAMCVQVSFNQLQALDAIQGKRVGISGLGPAGLVAIQMARAYGAAQVIAIDVVAERRALALTLGADQALAPDDAIFATAAGTFALDAAIDCTGLKVSIEFLMRHTKTVVAIFGVLRESVEFGWDHWRRGFKLLGYEPHNRQAAAQALDLIVQGKLQLAPLATHALPLTRYAEGVALLRSKQAIKVRFLPWSEA
ncbi:MAG: zinc-binding dehydrogenase [Caldilineaceae bacterium]|nr:zinc-binding dehydrogenase [Caldilineaceae bacterium]